MRGATPSRLLPCTLAWLILGAVPLRPQCGLLSWNEYRTARHSFPYILRLPQPPGDLVLFGVRHTRDPRDPQLAQLERIWREYGPEIAFSEGGVRPPTAERDRAVARYGEPGLLRFLADRKRVPIRSLEPPEREEAAAMAAQVDPERVKLFYVLRFIADGAAGEPSLEASIESALLSAAHRHRLAGRPESLRDLRAMAATLLPGLKDLSAIPKSWFDPTREDTFLNDVARRSSEYRNCHMVQLLTGVVREGKRVFAVVGGSHVVILEPALRTALGSNSNLR